LLRLGPTALCEDDDDDGRRNVRGRDQELDACGQGQSIDDVVVLVTMILRYYA